MKYSRKLLVLLILICGAFLVACDNISGKQPEITGNVPLSDHPKTEVFFSYTEINAEPGIEAIDIEGANFNNRQTMVSDGSRLYWIMPDYGNTIVTCDMNGQDRAVLYPNPKKNINGGGFQQLKIIDHDLFFVSASVGLFKMSANGGVATKLIEGHIQEYVIKDNVIYFSDFKSDMTTDDGYYALKSYLVDTQQITEIDQLSTGKELLKLGGYIVGFQDGKLIYTRRDDENKRSYYLYTPDGLIKSIPYEEGQKIEIEMAKKNLRPLDQQSSEVSHVEGKSLEIEYNDPDPNILFLTDHNNKQKIADVKGDYEYLFNHQIFVLDREGNIEHIIFDYREID